MLPGFPALSLPGHTGVATNPSEEEDLAPSRLVGLKMSKICRMMATDH